MTAPIPATPRPSTSIAFRVADAIGGGIYRLLGGAILFVPGGLMYMNENRHTYSCDEPLRTLPLGLATALMVAGALVVTPTLGGSIKTVVISFFPNGLPFIGANRRSSDQPPTPGAPQ